MFISHPCSQCCGTGQVIAKGGGTYLMSLLDIDRSSWVDSEVGGTYPWSPIVNASYFDLDRKNRNIYAIIPSTVSGRRLVRRPYDSFGDAGDVVEVIDRQDTWTGVNVNFTTAIDAVNERVFWVAEDGTSGHSVVNFDGTGFDHWGVSAIGGALAYDSTVDKLYFDRQLAPTQISRSDPDGSNLENLGLISGGVFDISIDHANQRIFWLTSAFPGNTIIVTDMDFGSADTILSISGAWAQTLSIQWADAEQRLYFVRGAGTYIIQSMLADGSDVQTHLSTTGSGNDWPDSSNGPPFRFAEGFCVLGNDAPY